MWWIVALGVFVIVLVGVGVVIGPFLTLKRLPQRAEINGVVVVKDGMVSASLVPFNEGEVALIDAGNDAEAKAILAELSRRGLTADDVKVILLTHGDADHVGGGGEVSKGAGDGARDGGRCWGKPSCRRRPDGASQDVKVARHSAGANPARRRGRATGIIAGPCFRCAGAHAGKCCVRHWADLVPG